MDTGAAIEDSIFARWLPDERRLRACGFRAAEGGALVLEKALPQPGFTIVIEYADGEIRAKIIELDMGAEYTNHRLEGATGFAEKLRQQFVAALLDVREKCCENQHFRTPQARRMQRHIVETYGDAPEFLWARFPGYAIYRRQESKKWYAVIANVPRGKVDGSAAQEEVEVFNLKAVKERLPALLARTGIYPAWHMNKQSWLTIILDDTLPDADIHPLLAASHASVRR